MASEVAKLVSSVDKTSSKETPLPEKLAGSRDSSLQETSQAKVEHRFQSSSPRPTSFTSFPRPSGQPLAFEEVESALVNFIHDLRTRCNTLRIALPNVDAGEEHEDLDLVFPIENCLHFSHFHSSVPPTTQKFSRR